MPGEINLGDNYQLDEDGSGNLVIKDSTGTTVLTHTDGGDWSYGANVDHGGNDVSNVGALETENTRTTRQRVQDQQLPTDQLHLAGRPLFTESDYSEFGNNGRGTLTVSSSEAYIGGKSLRLQATTSDERVDARFDYSTSQDFTNTPLSLAVKWVSPTESGEIVEIALFDSSGNEFQFEQAIDADDNDGNWTMLDFSPENDTSGGAFDPSSVDIFIVRHANNGQTVDFYVDNIRQLDNHRDRGAVIITADDGDDTQTVMRDKLGEYGYPGAYFVISEDVGASGKLTESQLIDIHNSGSLVGCHPQRDTRLPALSDADARAAIEEEFEFIAETISPTDARYMAWPYNSYNIPKMEIAAEYHNLAFSGSRGVHGQTTTAPYTVARETGGFDSTTAEGIPQQVADAIQFADEWNQVAVLTFHTFEDTSTSGLNITPSGFEAVLSEINSRGLDVMTPHEYWQNQPV